MSDISVLVGMLRLHPRDVEITMAVEHWRVYPSPTRIGPHMDIIGLCKQINQDQVQIVGGCVQLSSTPAGGLSMLIYPTVVTHSS
jgi:hypothetical protein